MRMDDGSVGLGVYCKASGAKTFLALCSAQKFLLVLVMNFLFKKILADDAN